MKRDLAIHALDMAMALHHPSIGCIHYTDHGSQYCSNDYQKFLTRQCFEVSMIGKRNSYGNSVVKTFFKTIKAELIWRDTWDTRRQAEMFIFEYINGFYNPRRRHSSLGRQKPLGLWTKDGMNELRDQNVKGTRPIWIKLIIFEITSDTKHFFDLRALKNRHLYTPQ